MSKYEKHQPSFGERVGQVADHMDAYWFPEMDISNLCRNEAASPAELANKTKLALGKNPRFEVELRESQVYLVKKEIREDLRKK